MRVCKYFCACEQSDTYFSIMAKHTKDMSAFHYAQQHCKKFGVGFTWKNLAKRSHSENASKFTKICQVKT